MNINSKTSTQAKRKISNRKINHYKIINSTDIQEFYQYKHLIGKGTFGTVYEVKDKKTNASLALKVIEKGKLGSKRSDVEREIQILKLVNHSHIIHLEVIYESIGKYYLLFELCNGTLNHLLQKRNILFEQEVLVIIRDLSGAVAYLHRNDIVHRDLKLENILLTTNPNDSLDQLYVKISDFGLSTILKARSHKEMLTSVCGTTPYMAPEILLKHSYSQQCDVWALGIITYLLLTGRFPFYHKSNVELKEMICKANVDYKLFNVSPEIIELIAKMLDRNPAFRITSQELEAYPCLNGRIGRSIDTIFDKMKRWKTELMSQDDGRSAPSTSDLFSIATTNTDVTFTSLASKYSVTTVDTLIKNVEKERENVPIKARKRK